MAVGKEIRGPLWVDGQFTVRVRGPGPEPGRIVRIRRPFALIGQIPGADIRIDDQAVDGRHAVLLLDRRGVFGVDLLTRSGTRFAGAASASSWLGAGDVIEIAGRRVELLQLRVDGDAIDPPLSVDDPLGDSPDLVGLTLEPLDRDGPPWMLGSALAFVGRGDACAIRIENASASGTHCALLRGPSSAHVIDLLGRRTLVNERAVDGASALLDGDVLTVGQARFSVRLDPPASDSRPHPDPIIGSDRDRDQPSTSTTLARRSDALEGPAGGPREALIAMLLDGLQPGLDAANLEVLDVLRRFQADTATLLEAQIDRIESLNREIATLREEVRGRQGAPEPPAEPLRLDLTPPRPSPSGESATWLITRLSTLETESRSAWKDLLNRVATAAVGPRAAPGSRGRALASTRPGPGFDGKS